MAGADEQARQAGAAPETASAAEHAPRDGNGAGGNGAREPGAAADEAAGGQAPRRAGEPVGAERGAGERGEGEPAQPPSEADLLRGELDKVKSELVQRLDAYLRLQAEFENFKKRMHKEQAEQLKYAQLPLLKDLTQAMDNLERALAHIRGQGGAEAQGLAGGIELVIKHLGDTFERFGMLRMKAADAPFDPTRHEAVSVVETDQVPENQVLQEFQAGYVLHERVVRPAMVSVSKRAGGGGTEPPRPKN
jgi:molecular chaperone GrpE